MGVNVSVGLVGFDRRGNSIRAGIGSSDGPSVSVSSNAKITGTCHNITASISRQGPSLSIRRNGVVQTADKFDFTKIPNMTAFFNECQIETVPFSGGSSSGSNYTLTCNDDLQGCKLWAKFIELPNMWVRFITTCRLFATVANIPQSRMPWILRPQMEREDVPAILMEAFNAKKVTKCSQKKRHCLAILVHRGENDMCGLVYTDEDVTMSTTGFNQIYYQTFRRILGKSEKSFIQLGKVYDFPFTSVYKNLSIPSKKLKCVPTVKKICKKK